MEGAVAAMGAVGMFAILIFGILILLIPIMIYSGQKYAYKCFHELKALNSLTRQTNDELAALGEQMAGQQRALYQLTRGLDTAGATLYPTDADDGQIQGP